MTSPRPLTTNERVFADARALATGGRLVYDTEVRDQSRAGFGRLPRETKFTQRAKYAVRGAAAQLDLLGKQHLRFLTATLPGSTYRSLCAIARYSGSIVERIEHWLKSIDKNCKYVLVWEYQKRGALHMHCCVYSASARLLGRIHRGFRDFWFDVLDRLSDSEGVDFYEKRLGGTWRKNRFACRASSEKIRKSVARYLSKYLSKGGKMHRLHWRYGDARIPCPSAWYGVERSLRADCKRGTLVLLFEPLESSRALLLFEALGWELAASADKQFIFRQRFCGGITAVSYARDGDLDEVWMQITTSALQLASSGAARLIDMAA